MNKLIVSSFYLSQNIRHRLIERRNARGKGNIISSRHGTNALLSIKISCKSFEFASKNEHLQNSGINFNTESCKPRKCETKTFALSFF